MSDQPPKVTIHSTETAAPAAPAAAQRKPGTITDARGRKIVVRQLDPLQVYRLAKIMGQAADSDFARGYASLAAAVVEFDGQPETFPNSDREIELMMQRLGADGMEAVQTACGELNDAKPKSSRESLKN